VETYEPRQLLSSIPAPPMTNFGVQSGPVGYLPAQVLHGYGYQSMPLDGAGQTIAIVDAYDNPQFKDSTAPDFSTSDLAMFDQAFRIPDPPSFTKYNQNGQTTSLPLPDPQHPRGDVQGSWEVEIALDVEWAHTIAPGASIDLVEANSSNAFDMYAAIKTARSLPGVSVVSISWGATEAKLNTYLAQFGLNETSFDQDFTTPAGHQGVTFVAATGDAYGAVQYPASSPNVVSVGGTDYTVNPLGNFASEVPWSNGGFGTSSYETEPAYQRGAQGSGWRTVPDVVFDAGNNPGHTNDGYAVYDSYDNVAGNPLGTTGPWQQESGTSVATPEWAATIALANQARAQQGLPSLDGPSQTLPLLYHLPSTAFHPINGSYGYQTQTGLGSPYAAQVVGALSSLRTWNDAVTGSTFQVFLANGSVEEYSLNAPATGAWSGNTVTFTESNGYLAILETNGVVYAMNTLTTGWHGLAGSVTTLESWTDAANGVPYLVILQNNGNVYAANMDNLNAGWSGLAGSVTTLNQGGGFLVIRESNGTLYGTFSLSYGWSGLAGSVTTLEQWTAPGNGHDYLLILESTGNVYAMDMENVGAGWSGLAGGVTTLTEFADDVLIRESNGYVYGMDDLTTGWAQWASGINTLAVDSTGSYVVLLTTTGLLEGSLGNMTTGIYEGIYGFGFGVWVTQVASFTVDEGTGFIDYVTTGGARGVYYA
jgi:hypothetical protein